MITRLRAAIHAWIERNIIATDPAPEYSKLDQLDGLGR